MGLRRLSVRAVASLLLVLAGCSPTFDWREQTAPGGEYRVQLPSRPASLTRPIHLEGVPVEMTMLGARIGETAFTVAVVPVPTGGAGSATLADAPVVMDPERLIAAMRRQMLRNIGASPDARTRLVDVDLVDREGRRVARVPMHAVAADGSGRHAGVHLEARFVYWESVALQAVVVGPPVPAAELEQFFGSLRLVRP